MAKDIEALTGADATDFGVAVRKFAIPNATVPASADFTWVNQGTASVSDETGIGMKLIDTYDTGQRVRALVKTMPATPYTMEAIVDVTQAAANYAHTGICIRDSASGRILTFGSLYALGTYLASISFSSASAVASDNYFATNFLIRRQIRGLRISDNGTNFQCSFSYDGLVWFEHGSGTSRTAYLTTPDQIGVYVNNTLGSGSWAGSAGITVYSFRTF